mgnify:CR=1 FL=1
MKNIGVLLFLLLCLSPSFAALGDYSFAYTLNTWQELTQGTVLGNESTDDEYFIHPDYPLGGSASAGTGFPIGFDLSFDGEVYDRFGVNANGWIGLGKSIYGAAAIDMRSI